ncbi:MAG TPA: Crp/Fnr family transcriptional regulator [Rhizomicrobium sp.]
MGTRLFDRSELIVATLRRVQLFSKWPAETLAALESVGQLWRYAKGEAVYEATEPATGLHIVVEGSLIHGRSWPNGKYMATTIVRPGWPMNVMGAWDGIPYPNGGIARSDSLVIFVPRAAFLAAVRGDPARIEDVTLFFCSQLRQDMEGLQARSVGSLRCLMAKYLAYLSRPSIHLSLAPGEPDAVDPTAFDVTQDELAAMLHTARQTVNRMMKEMERNGVLLREGNRLRIVNFLKLLAVMEEDEPIYSAWRAQIVAWHEKMQTKAARTADAARDPAPALLR